MKLTPPGAAALLLLFQLVLASGPARAEVRSFDLAPQPLVRALPEFARQAGRQILAPADHLKLRRAPRLRGAFEVRTALDRLIAGSGLEVAADDGTTITLRLRGPDAPPPAARPPPPPPDPAPVVVAAMELDPLEVLGHGRSRQVETLPAEELDAMTPGTSPWRMVSKLPNVNIQGGDPLGANEWSTRISIRAFSQGRLGFTLDDIPLGDMTYGNHNGLHASRAVIGESLASVELSQGAGDIGAPSSSNLGGTIRFTSRDPSPEPGGQVSLTAGGDETRRVYLRLDSGELASGARLSMGTAYDTAVRWQGAGRQYAAQLNLKATQPVGDGLLIATANLSRRRESDPQDLSSEMIGRLGYRWDNVVRDWPLAVRLAEIGRNRGETTEPGRFPEFGVAYPAPFRTIDDAYYDSTTARDDLLASLALHYPLGSHLDLRATVYGHWDRGQGLWWTPYVASPNYGVPGATRDDAPISLRATEYDIARHGLTVGLDGAFGGHSVSAGLWLEDNNFVQARRFYGEDRRRPHRSYDHFQTDPFLTEWVYHFRTVTRQVHVQDRWAVSDRLTVDAGFKALDVVNTARTRVGPVKDGRFEARRDFLPQLGASLRASENNEIFLSYAKSMRAFSASGTSGPFAASKEALDVIRPALKPEVSETFELGWRFRTERATGLLAVYRVRFRNRLFNTPVGGGILGNPPALANVGSVTGYGVETALDWQISHDWSVFGSYAFSNARYDDDVFDGDGRLIARTAGRWAVDAPQHLAKAEIAYAHGSAYARLGLSWLSERYYSYENDSSVPSQFLADLALGYRFNGDGWRDGLEVQANITNLLDSRYVSTIGSNDFPIRGDAQTLLAGPPREVSVTVRKAF